MRPGEVIRMASNHAGTASPVREMRLRLCMYQVQFASVLNISQSCLSGLENGYTPLPEAALRALRSLGINTDELVRDHQRFMGSTRRALRERARSSVAGR